MKKLIFLIYQILIWLPFFLASTVLTALVTIISMSLGGGSFWAFWPARLWSKFVCLISLVKVVVNGKDNIDSQEQYVFVANHQGAFDIWAIFGFLPHRFKWLMKKELENVFLVGYACKKSGHIFVDDSNISSVKETIAESEKQLAKGNSLVIFPEGSRTFDGKMIPFKRGAFMMAAEFRRPVVPLTIDGSFRRMPRTTYLINPGKIILTIHKPITPGEKGFNTKQLMAQCRQTINSALPPCDKDPE